MSPSARRPASAKQARRSPGLFSGGGRFPGIIPSREIMGADEEGVIVEHLSAWRLIVCVIQPHQSVPQKGSELAPGLGDLGGRSLRFENLRQIRPHLQYDVAVTVKPGGVFTPLASREQRLRHLKLAQLPSKRH